MALWGFPYLGRMDTVPSLALSQSLEHQEPAPTTVLRPDLRSPAVSQPLQQQRIPFHHHLCAQGDAVLCLMFLLSSFSMWRHFLPKVSVQRIHSVKSTMGMN